MKIAMYSPYVPKHVGGGEKYFFDVARLFAEMGHQVTVGIPAAEASPTSVEALRQKYEQFLQHSLAAVEFVATPLSMNGHQLAKLQWTKNFDVMYFVTDGSAFVSLARRNIMHIQFPLIRQPLSVIERVKFARWQVKNTNSEFTKKIVEKHWGIHVDVVHQPMLDPRCFQALGKKEKIILHVGRFFQQLHSKRQDILVEIFREMQSRYGKDMQGWKLVLIGSVEDQSYAQKVRDMARDLPIEVLNTVSRVELLDWYRRAAIYWHATGFGVDEDREPEKTEHFGISTGEAMAAGCVPVVLGKGGQPEVVGPKLAALMWQTQAECITQTLSLIRDEDKQRDLAVTAQNQVKIFSEEKFRQTLQEMLKS